MEMAWNLTRMVAIIADRFNETRLQDRGARGTFHKPPAVPAPPFTDTSDRKQETNWWTIQQDACAT